MKLTNIFVKNVKPTEKPKRYFDGGGLYLEVTKAGGKYWRMKYRYLKKEKRLALGVYPRMTLKMARDRLNEARLLLDDDIDPAEHKRDLRQTKIDNAANTFEEVGRELKEELYDALHKEGINLKSWFLDNVQDYLSDRSQLKLFVVEEDVAMRISK